MNVKPDLLVKSDALLRHFMLFVGIIVVVIFVLSSIGTSVGSLQEDKTIDFNNYPLLAAQIKKADKVILYEGLPHQRSEKELLAGELSRAKTITIHDEKLPPSF